MGGLFSKKPKSRITEQDKAVLQLKQQRDKLKMYQKKIEMQLEKDRLIAKQLLSSGRKERAKLMLRKKKFQESLLQKTDGQLDNIDQMVHNIEFAQIEMQVVQGLKSGNEALNKLHKLLTIEDAEKIMQDTQEAVSYQQEIDEILAGGLTAEDEEDVLNELDQLIKESMPDAPSAAEANEGDLHLPDVPKHKVAAAAEGTSKAKKKEAVEAS